MECQSALGRVENICLGVGPMYENNVELKIKIRFIVFNVGINEKKKTL